MSVRAIAQSTRISERYLHALERSDLDALPGGVFDKGYIKAYAQCLDIDPKPLLESYGIEERKRGRSTPEHERQKLAELSLLADARSRTRRRRAAWNRAPFLVLMGVVPSIYSSAAPDLIPCHSPRRHPGMLLPFFRCLVSVFKTRRELALENLALRQRLPSTVVP